MPPNQQKDWLTPCLGGQWKANRKQGFLPHPSPALVVSEEAIFFCRMTIKIATNMVTEIYSMRLTKTKNLNQDAGRTLPILKTPEKNLSFLHPASGTSKLFLVCNRITPILGFAFRWPSSMSLFTVFPLLMGC
jgi:hypothetical protein